MACPHGSPTISCEIGIWKCWFMRNAGKPVDLEKNLSNPLMALTLPDLNLGHIVGRQVFSPLHHPLLSSVPHQILACLCSPEILMQAISEKNQVPPTNTHPPSLIMIFFSSGSVQNVAVLRTKLHVNPDYNFSVLVDS